jgi:pimeloyl-ACP methyl ester carboxylesterase
LADLLAGIQTPVRIVAGADDQVVPSVNAEFLQQRLPHSRVDLIPGAGYFCWEEKPAAHLAPSVKLTAHAAWATLAGTNRRPAGLSASDSTFGGFDG